LSSELIAATVSSTTTTQAARSPRKVARGVIVLGVLLVIGTLVLDMSGSAARLAGSDGVRTEVFAVVVPGGGTVCQTVGRLPSDTGAAKLLVGTYYRPLPPLALRFVDKSGAAVALGEIRGGGRQGYITVPLRQLGPLSTVSRACLHVGGQFQVALGGTPVAAHTAAAVLNGKPVPGLVSIYYLRHGTASWWQFLPVLDLRFALGKASFFGSWTLPFVAVLVLLLWIAAIALVWRELG
jgi:hypothetical protein